ncbi:MAG: translation elongation factor Ts [Gammaproteobacteria bacterium]|jgi:elongation factor Ts
MAITAALVKELRERTQAGMMECKKALVETDGDIDAAVEYMRKAGLAKADKKAGRTAAEGVILARTADDGKAAIMVEINCETDFVTKGDDFQNFANEVADLAIKGLPDDLDGLLNLKMASGDTVAEASKALIAKIGENINVRRYVKVENEGGTIGTYLHGSRIGVVASLTGDKADLARDIAMHVAASRPVCVSAENVPQDVIDKEKEIYSAQAAESGKPADIIEKMVTGRINKFLKEITLLGQPFVKDPDMTVEKLLKQAGADVEVFYRLEVGEGVDKKDENFADEVMAQVKGS